MDGFTRVLSDVRACRLCRDAPHKLPGLEHEPRPVLQLSQHSKILIAGQAPGTRVHASGRPFTDRSGDRLRTWLGLDESAFYDDTKLAIVPMGFCFPGNDAKGGDKPPRPECRATWHDQLFAGRSAFDLTLVLGRYARDYHLPSQRAKRLTDTIAAQQHDLAALEQEPVIVLPHPSWRNTAWLKRNPWFEGDVVPIIRARVQKAMGGH